MAVATRTDEEVKKDVVDQLYWDGRVDASEVKVEVSGGEVTLSGTVPDYTAYEAAEEDSWATSGVRYVRDDLTIKYPAGVTIPTDAEIKSNIENTLLWQPNIDSADIDVSVANGWVTLRGNVDVFWKKVRVEELALSLSGVLGITNEISIVPTKEFTDKAVAEDIESAMERNSVIDQDMIDVEVEKGRVTLTGSVDSLPAFRAVQRIAENTPGVLMVNNELMIR